MTAVDDTAVPPPFPQRRDDPFRPPPAYEEWREETPAKKVTLQNGTTAWVVLRHKEAREVFESPHVSRDPSADHFPQVRAGQTFDRPNLLVNHTDPPLHGKFRKMLAPWFSLKRINSLRPGIQQIVDNALDRLLTLGKPANLHKEFSLVVPSTVICQLLGIDYSYHHDFERLARVTTSASADAATFNAAAKEMFALVERIVDEGIENPEDGVLNMLTTAMQAGEITREQCVANSFVLIVGGHETTAHTISMGLVQLFREPDKREYLRQNPEAIPVAIDEMLRMHSIADGATARVTTAELDLGGVTIPAGEGIIPVLSPANFDPRAWENGYTFKPDRGDSTHVGLGAGIHACAGQNLARAELEIVFETILSRAPSLQLAVPESEVDFVRDGFTFGVRTMPVTW
ncbi:cytochrome P450 [Nocardioides sp. NPDC051685]|uniref:cytochrome P450 n=1 Tax=Nocardioides sp. NPDC051685 TaxID=3364334 RepID=UPI0037AF1A7B